MATAPVRTRPGFRDAVPFAGPGRYSALLVILLAVLALGISLSVSIGAVPIPLDTIWTVIGHHLGLIGPV